MFEHDIPGPCPRCDAPGVYKYRLSGPEGEDGSQAYVDVSFTCLVCGYRLDRRIAFPVEALYLVRGLFREGVKLEVEKIYYASMVRRSRGG